MTVASPESTPRRTELNARTVIVGVVVAAFVGASYPYVVLKIGFGPTISVVSAFFAYLALSLVGRVAALLGRPDLRSNRFEWNLVQTTGTCASQASFMCVLLAAFDLLASKPALKFSLALTPLDVFLWISLAGCLGVLLAAPLRRHYIDEEKLTFPDGLAAGESLLILDEGREGAKRRLVFLGAGGALSALVTWLRDAMRLFPEATEFGARLGKLNVGMSWSLLSLGSGLIVGARVTLSMGLGMVLAWLIAPSLLLERGVVAEGSFSAVLRWVMWPATGLMVSGGITSLLLKWRVIARTFQDLRTARLESDDFPLRWVVLGAVPLTIALVILQKVTLGVSVWISLIALAVSLPLMLVGIRVLGETNWAPISAMANLVQAVFAFIAPGSYAVNMVASGMSGTVAGAGEQVMQDYKSGHIIGNRSRSLTVMQLIAMPVGAAAVALVYPLLRRTYGIGPERYGIDAAVALTDAPGLTSPISVKWAGFAELLMGGSTLPAGSLAALGIAVALGVVVAALEGRYRKLPSPTGVALGMLIPAMYVLPMVLGGAAQWLWSRLRPKQEEELATPLASGLIVGEAMLALVIPLLLFFGVLGGS